MTLKLFNGFDFPALGLGTLLSKPGQVENAVKAAIDCGYRHIDCAAAYLNEHEVGNALKEKIGKVIKREDVFVTSKLWSTNHAKEDVEPALRKTLSDLQLDYIDLYLVHSPMSLQKSDEIFPQNEDGTLKHARVPHLETWTALEACVDKGLVRSIGISNFNSKQIANICDNCRIQPAVLQIESHPYLNQKQLIDFCRERNIVVTAYCPLGASGRAWAKSDDPNLLKDIRLEEIAKNHGKSVAQICIKFQIQRKVSAIPKSVTPERIKQNADVFDFELTNEEMEKIMSMNIPWRVILPKIIIDGKEVIRDQHHPDYPLNEPF